MKKENEIRILKDISDRIQIIRNYYSYGNLDRDTAIKMINHLRMTDEEVAEVTVVKLAVSSTPFSEATDQGIVDELQMQVYVLLAKLESRNIDN